MFPPTTEIEARKVLVLFTGGHRVSGTNLMGFELTIEFHPGGTWTVEHEFPEEGIHEGTAIDAVNYLASLVTWSGNPAPVTAAELVERLTNY